MPHKGVTCTYRCEEQQLVMLLQPPQYMCPGEDTENIVEWLKIKWLEIKP